VQNKFEVFAGSLKIDFMRFVKLTEAELVTLQEGHKNGSQFQFRNRCQCLIFSSQGRTIPELAQFFEVSRITIYQWLDRWESQGLVGLMNKPGRGRKPILSLQNPTHVESVKTAVRKNAQSVKAVVAELETVLDEKMSTDTVKRFLKNLITASAASARVSNRGKWVLNEKRKKRP
jgi:transposase